MVDLSSKEYGHVLSLTILPKKEVIQGSIHGELGELLREEPPILLVIRLWGTQQFMTCEGNSACMRLIGLSIKT